MSSIVDKPVLLFTSKEFTTSNSEKWVNLNVPICVVNYKLNASLKKINKKRIKKICKESSDYVYINAEKKLIYIGSSSNKGKFLVKHHINEENELEEIFLERWLITKLLFFEFCVYNKKDKFLFSLKGLWDGINNQWISIKIEKHRTITRTSLNKHKTFIPEGIV